MLFLLATYASAQSPMTMPITFGGPGPNDRWIVTETTSKRFPGEEVAGPTFQIGEEVELIVEENGLARVHAGDRYGWVPLAVVTDKAPAAAPPPVALPAGNSLLGGVPQLPPPTPKK